MVEGGGVHRTHSLAQPAGLSRTRTATTRANQSDGQQRVASHRTRSLRVSRRFSSPKTQATRPDHKINKIRARLKSFQTKSYLKSTRFDDIFYFLMKIYLKSTRSSEISSRSTLDSTDPAKYRPDLDRSNEISAPAVKYQNRWRNLKLSQHQPETRRTRTR